MARLLVLLVVSGLVAAPSPTAGQVCSGSASFAQGPFQVFGSAAFNDDAKAFGGGFAFGGARAFGQLSIGRSSFDELERSSLNLAGGAGYQFSLDPRSTLHLCPIASVALGFGPNDIDVFGDGSLVVDLSQTEVVLGLALGAIASRSGQMQIIPSGSLAFVSATVKTQDEGSGASDSETETLGLLGVGVGFVFNQIFTLHPSVAIPFGLEGASTTFGVGFSVSFGRRPK